MPNPQPPGLEITRALSNQAKAARFDFGEDTALVTVQHMILQTVDLFQAVCDLGLPPENIFAAGKVYSDSPPVIRALREMGVTVVDSTMPEPGEFNCYFQRDIDRLWKIAVRKLAQRRIKRLLVLDDGGMCITSVPREVLQRYAACGVEQTSQGIFLFEEKPPPFVVISWARTAVKLELGGAIFSRCFIDKLTTLHGPCLQGAQVAVIGLGSIGKGIANLARRQNAQVLFYDPDPNLHLPGQLRHRIARASSLEQLLVRSDYVVGCSGRNPFNNLWPLNYRPQLKLFSCSGGDQEFGPIINDLKTRPGFKVDPHSWDITSEYGPSGPIHIAYRGFPYTFVLRGTEAVETRVVQLETGGLLAGLIQARLYLKLCEMGFRHTRKIQRLSTEAQRFIYRKWRAVMNRYGIDVCEVYGYDPAVLRAAQCKSWYSRKSEPSPITDISQMPATRGSAEE